MMPKYNETGKFSKAWYMRAVFNVGAEKAGKAAICQETGQIPAKMKLVLDDLIGTGLVRMEGVNKKNGFQYYLTDKGEEYLAAHIEDAIYTDEQERDPTPERSEPIDTHHPVPASVPRYAGEPDEAQHTIGSFVKSTHPWRNTKQEETTDDEDIEIPEEEPAELEPEPTEAELSDIEAQQPDFVIEDPDELEPRTQTASVKSYLTSLLGEMLLERHPDEITAKELIDRL